MIDYEQWKILRGIGGIHNRHAPVIEDQPMLIFAHGKHSVLLSSWRFVTHHDQPTIICGDAKLAKGIILGNRIIRAIASAVRERSKRCRPYLGDLVVTEIIIGRIARLIARFT